MVRVFYAHGSNEDPGKIKGDALSLRKLLESKFQPGEIIVVVPGRRDFAANFTGDWNAWTGGVINRKSIVTGEPVYKIFVTPNETCGRATAQLLNTAIDNERAVFHWNKETVLERVENVCCVDPEDWSGGYSVALSRQVELFNDSP